MITPRQRDLMNKLEFWKRERRIHESGECGCSNEGACSLRLGDVKVHIRDIAVKLNELSRGDR